MTRVEVARPRFKRTSQDVSTQRLGGRTRMCDYGQTCGIAYGNWEQRNCFRRGHQSRVRSGKR